MSALGLLGAVNYPDSLVAQLGGGRGCCLSVVIPGIDWVKRFLLLKGCTCRLYHSW